MNWDESYEVVVIGSGIAGVATALAAREAGFNLHVPKPIDIDRFVAALSVLVPRCSAASSVESARRAAAP